ncbi:MAG TPA: DUF2610 domain-containing protein [Thermoanaerobaculia bacterium]
MAYEELVIHLDPHGSARLVPSPSGSVATALLEIAHGDAGERWLEDVMAVLDVPFARRRPSRVLELALRAPAPARPLLLAELWHLLLTGAHHDPVYNLAVSLDARGDALSNPPRLLAETLAAAARRVPPRSRWRIAGDPGGSVPAAALGALSSIPRDLDFLAGWALVRLQGVFADAGLLDDARSLASGLSGRFSDPTPWARQLEGGTDVLPTAAPLGDDAAVRRWRVPCDFGSRRGTAAVLIGRPAPGFHPLCFQAAWIREQQGGEIPPEVMGRIRELSAAPELAR